MCKGSLTEWLIRIPVLNRCHHHNLLEMPANNEQQTILSGRHIRFDANTNFLPDDPDNSVMQCAALPNFGHALSHCGSFMSAIGH